MWQNQFWNTYAAANTFESLLAPARATVLVDLGPITTAAGLIYTVDVTLPAPVTLTGADTGTSWGWAPELPGDSGSGFGQMTERLTSLITSNTAGTWASGQILTGASPAFGYYRNASGHTDFNFDSGDARSLAGVKRFQGLASSSTVPTSSAS